MSGNRFFVDAAYAKTAAKTVKTRLEALGHSVSLNHAYEAVASTFGYPNWAVMKAAGKPEGHGFVREAARTTDRDASAGASTFNWANLLFSDGNPVALVFGPANARRDRVLQKLVLEEPRAFFIRAIFKDEDLPEAFCQRTGMQIITLGGQDDPVVNIFDTRPGKRMPDEAQLERLIDYLVIIFQRAKGLAFSDRIVLRDMLLHMYQSYATEHPLRYFAGTDKDIDIYLADNASKLTVDTSTTWWELVDAFLEAGATALAKKAQDQASPTLSMLRSSIDAIVKKGDLARGAEHYSEDFNRLVAFAIRAVPILDRRSNVSIDQSASTLCVQTRARSCGSSLASEDLALATDLLFQIACDAIEKSVARSHERPVHPVTFVLSGLSGEEFKEPERHGLRQMLNLAYEGFSDILLVSSATTHLDRLGDVSSSIIVTGSASRRDVEDVCRNLALSGQAYEDIHEHVYAGPAAASDVSGSIPTFGVRKKFKSTAAGIVFFPEKR